MRRVAVASVFSVLMCMLPACQGAGDPNAFETHVSALDDPTKRVEALNTIARLVKAAKTADSDERLKEFAEKVLPKFTETFDAAKAEKNAILMLEIARDAARPEACPLWQKAIVLDGTPDSHKGAQLALQGIRESKAVDCAEAVAAELQKTTADPSKDSGEQAGLIRYEYAKTLGELRDKRAVPALLAAVQSEPDLPEPVVHREAVRALGMIRDAAAIPALLEVTYRVPDMQSTQDIFNRAMVAIGAIGEPAVDAALDLFRGNNAVVTKIATEQGLDAVSIKIIASQFLGVLGSKKATEDLVAFMPKDDCLAPPAKDGAKDPKKPEGEEDEGPAIPGGPDLRLRIAQQLGIIGDEAAADALCQCAMTTRSQVDYYVSEALASIGGPKAYACLLEVVAKASYADEWIASSDFRYTPRWEAIRLAAIAAPPEDIGKLREAIDKNDQAKVKDEAKQWDAGIAVVEKCKVDKGCYVDVIKDLNADWFAREVAAYQVSRLAPGDQAVAIELSKAFRVRNPAARVSMAMLADRVMSGNDCAECVKEFDAVMEGEKGTMDAAMQPAVIRARQTMAKLEPAGGI